MREHALALAAVVGLFLAGPTLGQDASPPEVEDVPPEFIRSLKGARPTPLNFCPPDTSTGTSGASLIGLLGNPSAHDGKRVTVMGFLHLEFEGNALYIDRGAFDGGVTDYAVGLQVRADDRQRVAAKLNDRFVIITGTFRASPEDGFFDGQITEISSIRYWPSRREILRELRSRGWQAPNTSFGCPSTPSD